MKAGSKTVFGIFLIVTILFVLWLYDTNRFAVVLGALKGQTNIVNPSTGGALPTGVYTSSVPQTAVNAGNVYQTPVPVPNGQVIQVPKGSAPPALPNPTYSINPSSFISTFINNQLNSLFGTKVSSPAPAPTINTIPGINGTVLV